MEIVRAVEHDRIRGDTRVVYRLNDLSRRPIGLHYKIRDRGDAALYRF